MITNHGCLTIIFSISILSPKFTDEAIDQTNKLFSELESYLKIKQMTYFKAWNLLIKYWVDKKLKEIPLDEPLPHDMLT
ncbi:unnamed protein product [Rhizophagus irregularis]|nr:unnamed protein product [Rhizophagus irregularis]